MPVMEFFFDCSSPWTYLGFHNVQPLAAQFGVDLRWRPILVGGVFNAVNPSVYESRSHRVPAKHSYARKSLLDWARWSGLEVNPAPRVFPVNSVKVMRGCVVLEPMGKLVPFARAAFEAYWRDDLDISQDLVVGDISARAGIDPEFLLQAIGRQGVKDALRRNTEELVERGGFGSPTIFIDQADMYFGNDHLPLVRAALESQASAAH